MRLEGLLLLAHYLTSLLQQMCFGVHSVCDPESAQEKGWQGRWRDEAEEASTSPLLRGCRQSSAA